MSEKLLNEINEAISLKYINTEGLGVCRGMGGLIMYKFYYAKLTNSEKEFKIGERMINHTIDIINNGNFTNQYGNGLLGFCWIIQHLSERNMIKLESDSFLTDLDDILYKEMILGFKHKVNYDFFYGSIGFAYYFSKRFKAAKTIKLKKRYQNILNEFIGSIEKTAIKDPKGGLKWQLVVGIPEDVKSIIDLGLAHGTPSVVNFLANLIEFPELKDRVKPLMEQGLFYILNKKIYAKNNLSLFPRSETNPTLEYEKVSRLAWCYGDLGIGITVWKVGKSINNVNLKQEAIRIFEHSAKRKSLEDNFVFDAGLCHGAFGISQMFGRMYKNTGNQDFKKTSDYWKKNGIEMGIHENEYAGYKAYTKNFGDWSDKIGLLEGIAGIGLSLISHLVDFEDDWDECLLIS